MHYFLTQCCGIAILITILYFHSFRRKIMLQTGKCYFQMVIATIVCTFLDIFSIFCILNVKDIPYPFVVFICKSYIVSLMTVAIFGLKYVCADVFKNEERYKKTKMIIFGTWLAMAILIYCLPISIVNNAEDGLYTEGPATLVTYLCVASIAAAIVIVILSNRKCVHIIRRRSVYFWIICWACTALIQFNYSELLIVSFGSALGVLVIFIALENPERNIDRRTGFFNDNALSLYAQQQYISKTDFTLLYVQLQVINNEGMRLYVDGQVMKEINKYIESFDKADIFILNENEICMAFVNRDYANDSLELIRERFNYGWGEKKTIIIPTKYMFVPRALDFAEWEYLTQATRYLGYSGNSNSDVTYVTPDALEGLSKEHEIEEIIRDAIENDRIEAYYQPIYNTETGKFASAEALARIRREDGSIVPPNVFIPIAEKNGTIVKIGEIIFEKVCKLLSRELLSERFDVKYIEVNLSTIQCAYENLADSFISIMNKNHVDPSWINLEVTETGSISEKSILLKNMNELMLYGVKFSLDDFGTGNSNLNYILDMPVSIVKFDRGFVISYFNNERAKHVMSSTIKMLIEMGLEIVTEGVETKEQCDDLTALGTRYIQGYYFSKPLTMGDYINFLENNTK